MRILSLQHMQHPDILLQRPNKTLETKSLKQLKHNVRYEATAYR
jgi:hypothetical protein